MTRRRTVLAFVALAVCATAMTGCTAADPDPEPVATSSARAGETSTPAKSTAPTEDPADPADPATWIVTGSGIGPVTIGRDVGEFATVGPYVEHDAQCPNPAVHRLASDGLAPMTLVADDGTSVASVHVTSWGTDSLPVSSPKTAEGIGLGASLSDVQATYAGIALTSTSNETPQYAYPDGDGWVVFTFQDDLVVVVSASTTSSNPSELCG